MENFKAVLPKELNENPFSLLADDWALVTAGDEKSFNTMTVSWGGVGVLWNKNVATIYIRPQRYTKEFIEANDYFTISVLPNDFKPALMVCGRTSGRDCNKVKDAGLTPVCIDGEMTFNEARLVFICKKIYCSDIDPEKFYSPDIDQNYPDNDYHRMYIGEIIHTYMK